MSNVIPFPGRTVSPWLYIGDVTASADFSGFSKGHPFYSVFSEEDLLKAMSLSRPAFVLIQADLTWSDPLQLISQLNQHTNSPILLLLKKQNSKKQEAFIRRAYQAGILDILYLPLQDSEVEEVLDLILRISKKAISL